MEITYTCTPWRSAAELLDVRAKLYRLGQHELDDGRRSAIDRILAWEERGEIPLAVNSTVLLAEAILYDNGQLHSPLAVRMAYSAAILRFVTGICDAMQDDRIGKQSMLQIAIRIKLPAELVEARHAISHKELPSLPQLRTAAELGVRWLWDWYWSKLDDILATGANELPGDDLQSIRTRLQASLKQYLSDRRTEVKKRAKSADVSRAAALAISKEFGTEPSFRHILLSLLVNDNKMIVPSDKRLGSPMEGAFLLWDVFLQHMSKHQEGFLLSFLAHMHTRLGAPATIDITRDPVREALCQWIVRILTSDAWSRSRKDSSAQLQQGILEECFISANHWSLLVASELLQTADNSIVEKWQPLLDSVSNAIEELEPATGTTHVQPEENKLVEEFKSRPYAPGWSVRRGYRERRYIGQESE